MDWLFNGIPLHPLLVHFVVIVVPLAALLTVVSTAWRAARARFGLVTPIVALAGLVCVPLTTSAGEALEEQVSETALTEVHTELGENLLPWAVALFAVALVQWIWFHYLAPSAPGPTRIASAQVRTLVTIVLIVAAVAVATGSIVTVVLIGESGARAVWDSRLG